jgi:uncharacterized protein (TIRG00374 family)
MRPGKSSLIKLVVTISLLLVFIYVSNPLEVIKQLTQVKPSYYVLGLLIFSTVYPLNGLRWKIMTEKALELSLSDSIKIIGISYGLNKILPLNSGDIARSKITEQYTEVDRHGNILGIVALERMIDIIILSLLLIFAAFSGFSDTLGSMKWIWMPLAMGTAIFASAYFFEEIIKDIIKAVPDWATPDRFRSFLEDTLEGFNSLDRRQYSRAVLLTSLRWLFNVAAFYIVALSAGYPIGLATAGLLTGVMSLISSMPVTPAGAGLAEISASSLLVFTGFDVSAAATVVILQRSLGVIFMGLVGIVLINFENFDIEKFRI